MHIIQALAAFGAVGSPVTAEPNLKEACQLLITDLVAAAAAGFTSDLAAATWSAAAACYGAGGTPVWFRGASSSILGAAMSNAAAASALDLDDGHRGAAGHPGAGVIPAAMALADATGATDNECFDAIVIGYDVCLRIATARPPESVDSWASGKWVGYGVAAAASRLLRLDAEQTAHALAIAGAEGPIGFRSGSSRYQGSSVKEQIPAAVVAGVTAAYRAKAGATGPLDLLDDPGKYRRDVLLEGLGRDWWLRGCYLKPYACCRYMHAAVDAIVALRDYAKPIKRLSIETFPRGLGLTNERSPATLEGAQYSYYFSCAIAALYGPGALQPVSPAALKDAAVLELAHRIELASHADFADAFPSGTPCRVLLDQGDGIEQMTVLAPLGDVSNPMSLEQVLMKFRKISAGNLDASRQLRFEGAFRGLVDAGPSALTRLLSEVV